MKFLNDIGYERIAHTTGEIVSSSGESLCISKELD